MADSILVNETEIPAPPGPVEAARARLPKRLDELFPDALEKVRRRHQQLEKPLPLPWKSIADLYGGGLWPGLHVLVAGTGAGKSTFALQAALSAARAGHPVVYVGLELGELQVALRVVGEQAGVSWSKAYTGSVSTSEVERLELAMQQIAALQLPFYPEFGPTKGWPLSRLRELATDLRAAHPHVNGPVLIVIDFLQLVSDEEGVKPRDLRERVGEVAYAAREAARANEACILLVSSAARDKYAVLSGAVGDAGIVVTKSGTKSIARPDTLVGLGKESGEIEYAADSVTVAIKLPDPLADGQRVVVFGVPKLRWGAPTWTYLTFTGTSFVEPTEHEVVFARDQIESANKEAQKSNRGGK